MFAAFVVFVCVLCFFVAALCLVAHKLPGGVPAAAANMGIVDALPTVRMEGETLALYAKKQCYICLMQFANRDHATVLPCTHAFHSACIRPWLAAKRTFLVCCASLISSAHVLRICCCLSLIHI